MNSCDYYQELISRLVDGDLSRGEQEALMEHMKSCSACNAMYAVFHDLSDILAGEEEPLPAGLHENIMASVRRSEMRKRNRRMRTFGLSTALTAAACAVLVLFAAAGFAPGKRAESVTIRAEEAAQLPATAAPASHVPEEQQAQPPVTAAPVSPAPLPAQTLPPADAYPAYDGGNTQYNATQQNDLYVSQPAADQAAAPVIPQAETPVLFQAETPVITQAETPVLFQAETPVITQAQTPAARQTQTPVITQAQKPVQTAAPVLLQPAPAPAQTAAPVQTEAPAQTAAVQNAAPAQTAAPALRTETAPAETAPAEEAAAEEGVSLFSFFGDMGSFFSAGPDALEESKISSDKAGDAPALFGASVDSAAPAAEAALPEAGEPPMLSALPAAPGEGADARDAAEDAVPAVTPAAVSEERVNVYGKAQRAQLLAMLGETEAALPEAELTRLVHVSFVPEDAYGSTETMDIRIYGDFVFCQRFPAEGGSKSYQAACSLRDLDSFLLACKAAASPSPVPTADPFAAAGSPAPAA